MDSPESDTNAESKQLDPARLTHWYGEFSSRVRAFLYGLLRNPTLVDEALQTTFTKALLHGGEVQAGSERAWLFQVAYNEAMGIRRREGIDRRALQKLKDTESQSDRDSSGQSLQRDSLLQWEMVNQVQAALSELPADLRIVVTKRIYEEKTFQQLADELKIPLGTALTRMRTALQKLQVALQIDHGTEREST